MLTLAEELMLLAVDDKTGQIVPNAQSARGGQGPLKMGLVSAALTELTLTKKLAVDGMGSLIAANANPTGDVLHDEIVNRVWRTQPPRPTHFWLQGLTNDLHNVERQVIESLVRRGALRVEESRKFFIVREVRYPEQNGGFERNTRERLRDVVIRGVQPDERTMALIGLIKMTHLLETVFDYTEWEQARRRIDELTNPQFAGWQFQQPAYGSAHDQPTPMGGFGGMMSGFVPSLMFSMMAQSMFWGMGGWMMPGMMGFGGIGLPAEDPLAAQYGEDAVTEVNNEGDTDFGDVGGDFGDFGGDF